MDNLQIIQSEELDHTLVSSDEDSGWSLSLRITEFEDEKDSKRFIKNCEGIIRKSKEYHLWTSFLRESLSEYICCITGEQNAQTRVDIHHHPINLYRLVKGVVFKNISTGASFCTFDICTKIMELHFTNKIGYIPIVSSLHEKFHNGFLDIPIDIVRGSYKEYLDEYWNYLDESDQDAIRNYEQINQSNCGWTNYWKKDVYTDEFRNN